MIGTVQDAQGAVIVGAEINVENPATENRHSTTTDSSGSYWIRQLSPTTYDVKISAQGFRSAVFHAVAVGLAETATINANLQVAQSNAEVTVTDAPPPVRSDNSELTFLIDSRSLDRLPLPTRNFLQLLTLAPGVTSPLTNNSAIGRNSPNVSVNGARVTQNSYQINGMDAGDAYLHIFADVAVPAPESVGEINVQTSLYDASVTGAGGSVQVVTKSGSNSLHGNVYGYFRNEALDGNDANLNAVGLGRPVMRRNVYGATVGGPLRKNKAFFFVCLSRHTRRERRNRPKLVQERPHCTWLNKRPFSDNAYKYLRGVHNRPDFAATPELQTFPTVIFSFPHRKLPTDL